MSAPGMAVIINSGHNRPGHARDTQRLLTMFRGFGIKVELCPLLQDDGPTLDEVNVFVARVINELRRRPQAVKSLWLVLMGHGRDGHIGLSRGRFNIMETVRSFNIPEMADKLKVGFIHCCRGLPHGQPQSPMPSSNDLPPHSSQPNQASNWCLVWSTSEGNRAYRDQEGTPFVRELSNMFNLQDRMFQSSFLDLFGDVAVNLEASGQRAVVAHTLSRPRTRMLDLMDDKKFVACIDLGTSGTAICVCSEASGGVTGEHHPQFGYHGIKEPSDVVIQENLGSIAAFENVYNSPGSPYHVFREAGRVFAVIFGGNALHQARQNPPPTDQLRVRKYYFHNFKQQLNGVSKTEGSANLKILDMFGKEMDAEVLMMLIFSWLARGPLQDMQRSFLKQCNRHDINPQDMRLAVTVPAHWGLRAQQVVRRGARRANLFSSEGDFILVIEPEAAAYHCVTAGMGRHLREGERFFVADVGGGTVDYSVMEVVTSDPWVLKVVAAPQGTTFGANWVTELFIDLLKTAFDANIVEDNRMEIATAWEQLRRRGGPLHNQYNVETTLPLPQNLLQGIPAESRVPGISWDAFGRLHLSRDVVSALFGPLTDTVCAALGRLHQQFPTANTVFLVGAFANQFTLTSRVEELGLEVATPDQPELAVSIGGAQIGKEPSRISSRVAMFSYGVKMSATSDLHRFPGVPQARLSDGRPVVHNVFNRFRSIGEEIQEGSQTTRSFAPLTRDQAAITFDIYATTNSDAIFVTEEHMEKIGTLTINVGDNPDLVKSVKVTFHFQGNFVQITAKRERDDHELSTDVEFFGCGEYQVDPDALTFAQP